MKEQPDASIALRPKGIIQPSASPWGASLLFAPKKNGKLRMCFDNKVLNLYSRRHRQRIRQPVLSQHAGRDLGMHLEPVPLERGGRAGVVTTLAGYRDLDAPRSDIASGAGDSNSEIALIFAELL